MKRITDFVALAALGLAVFLTSTALAASPKNILVVTVTTGFRHSSIETAEKVLEQMGKDSGVFNVEFARVTPPSVPRRPNPPKETGDPVKDKAAKEKFDAALAKFTTAEAETKDAMAKYAQEQKAVLAEKMSMEALKKYDAVIFANTTGTLPVPDMKGFIDWVRQGHGFAAMHSGSDTFHGGGTSISPYIEMLGGEFQHHGPQVLVECINMDPAHPATKHFGASWDIEGKKEEIYQFKNYDRTKVHELLILHKHPETGAPGNYAMSWCKDFGKGKVFYTSLGHNEYVWQ